MSQATKIFSIVILIILGLFVWFSFKNISPVQAPNIVEELEGSQINIETKEIKTEKNFTGEEVIITGEGALADEARAHVASRYIEFKMNADDQVPQMREDFGDESPVSQYFLQMGAEYVKGEKTESIIITEYAYTGGANGMSSYKAFTSSLETGTLLNLSDIIKDNQKSNFLKKVKTDLIDWRPYEQTETVVFEEDVDSLELSGLTNWALDEENLILYFSKYEVGPGALGAFEFTIPLVEIEGMINL